MTLVAGVDSSTQSCKIVIVDAQTGAMVRSGRASHPEGTEVDPTLWWDALLAAISDAGGLDDVAALSIAGQQHGMVCLDEAGEVVRPALLWNDTRSADAARDLIAEIGADVWAESVGTVPVASFTATKLRWLRDAEPQNAARTAAVALPHDYLTWRLLGYGPANPDLDALVTDRSDASGTGYWSPATGAYRLDFLERALGKVVTRPRVLAPYETAGSTDGSIAGVPAGIVVGPGAGDNAGAALGLGAAEGDAVISVGTSGTVFAVVDRPLADASGTVAGFADASGLFLPLVATLNAARVIAATAALLATELDEVADLALSASPGAGGVVLLPYLEGERTPNLPTATGSVLGLTLANASAANLARASVEGMLCGLADGLDAITSQGVTVDRVMMIGGGAQSPAVRQIAPEIFGLPVTVPAAEEYVAVGAARQAAWVLTGELPIWAAAATEVFTADEQPIIRRQYAAAQRSVSY
ncbi:xylulokinase [Lacisediminihabitans changchengi]|uniref:Xylulose kinase n=1 Tax=Lacisediminihabitans changchengi TaxID=2787634 RepID=A0A934SNL0_9MICO|nr:xylulokinase [Lacisediminihabitans changchengi]MBK4348838.1 xylulokinase [Lacisediminihabitans changchengi]